MERLEEDLPSEGVAVRVKSRRGKAQENVARSDRGSVDPRRLFGDAELGAASVHARGEELPRRAGNPKRSREGAEVRGHVGIEGGADQLADALERFLSLPDVHARLAVAAHGKRSSTRPESDRAGTSLPSP